MIVNIFFTDGMYEHGELFIDSFRNFHSTKIVAVTRDLNNHQVNELKQRDNIIVNNEPLNYKKLAKKASVSIDELFRMKKGVERGKTTKDNYPWKWLIAGGERIDALYGIVKEFHEEGVLHFDVDTYVRNDISGLFEMVKRFDVCMRQRPNHKKIAARAIISLMGLRGPKSVKFMERWLYRLKRVAYKPGDVDQECCFYTIQDLKNRMKIGNMVNQKNYPFISSLEEADADMWFGNRTGRTLRSEKISKFRGDYEKRNAKKMGCVD